MKVSAGVGVQPPGTGARGYAAVELALLLPVYLILMMGVGEIGRACYEYNTLTKLVRAGAQHLARVADSGAGVIDITGAKRTATRNLVVFGSPAGGGTPLLQGLSTGDITVVAVDATHVAVSATYAYTPLFAVIPTFGMGGGNIQSLTTMNAAVTVVVL